MSKFSRMLAVIGAAIIGLGMSAGVVAQTLPTQITSASRFSREHCPLRLTVTGFGNVIAGETAQGTISDGCY